jgi:hypothetical protein
MYGIPSGTAVSWFRSFGDVPGFLKTLFGGAIPAGPTRVIGQDSALDFVQPGAMPPAPGPSPFNAGAFSALQKGVAPTGPGPLRLPGPFAPSPALPGVQTYTSPSRGLFGLSTTTLLLGGAGVAAVAFLALRKRTPRTNPGRRRRRR